MAVVDEFKATVRDRGPMRVIDLGGDIDITADERLRDAYAKAAAAGPGPVLLNFERVGYINSTGIALIVELLARARRERRVVIACGLSDHYRNIFEITRLSDFMTIYVDEDSAADGPTNAAPTAPTGQQGAAR
jgi:anti-sigma B factor antagonist